MQQPTNYVQVVSIMHPMPQQNQNIVFAQLKGGKRKQITQMLAKKHLAKQDAPH
jgi:hypothetical protein